MMHIYSMHLLTIEVTVFLLAMEVYDFRCEDVKKMTFPNYCHSNYAAASYWKTISDRIDVQFVWENSGKMLLLICTC